MDDPIESYSQEAVQQILQAALAQQNDTEEFSRCQLVEMALELGISPDQLQVAEAEWHQTQGALLERQEFDQFRQEKLTQNSAKFLIINVFLMLLDGLTSQGGLHWSLVVLVVWGMGLALEIWQTFHRSSPEYENKFQQWRRRRQIKQSVSSLVKQVGNRLKPVTGTDPESSPSSSPKAMQE
jgi:hypothetical protein